MPSDRYVLILGLNPVEKCSLQVLGTSVICTLPPETASVLTTTVTMQSEEVADGRICLCLVRLETPGGF